MGSDVSSEDDLTDDESREASGAPTDSPEKLLAMKKPRLSLDAPPTVSLLTQINLHMAVWLLC